VNSLDQAKKQFNNYNDAVRPG
jgi:hypothetical protein